MAQDPRDVMTFILCDARTLTAADGKDVLTIPADMHITKIHWSLGTTGSTSGNVDVTVYYTPPTTTPTGSGLETAGDLWTVAAGRGRMAYNAAAHYQEIAEASLAIKDIEAGGTLSLNVDVIDGGGTAANLAVIIYGYPIND